MQKCFGRHAKSFVTFLLHSTFDKSFLLQFINKPKKRLKVQNPAENHDYNKNQEEDFNSDGIPMYEEKPNRDKKALQKSEWSFLIYVSLTLRSRIGSEKEDLRLLSPLKVDCHLPEWHV